MSVFVVVVLLLGAGGEGRGAGGVVVGGSGAGGGGVVVAIAMGSVGVRRGGDINSLGVDVGVSALPTTGCYHCGCRCID